MPTEARFSHRPAAAPAAGEPPPEAPPPGENAGGGAQDDRLTGPAFLRVQASVHLPAAGVPNDLLRELLAQGREQRAELAALREELAAARRPQIVPTTWAAVTEQMEALHAPPAGAKKTWENYRQALREIQPHAAAPEELDAVAVRAFVLASLRSSYRGKRRGPCRTNALVRTLAAVAAWLAHPKRRHLAASPFTDSTFEVPTVAPAPKSLTMQELSRVLSHADAAWCAAKQHAATAGGFRAGRDRDALGRTRALLYVLSHTGCRREEALYLRWADVRFDDGVLELGKGVTASRGRRAKTKASVASVPLPPDLADALREWQTLAEGRGEWVFAAFRGSPRPWIGGGPDHNPCELVRRLAAAAGVEHVTPHRLRHTFATLADELGLTQRDTQMVLRHTKPETTVGYQRPHLRRLAALGAKVRFPRLAAVGAA